MSINLRTDRRLRHLKKTLCEVTVLLEEKKTPLMRPDTNPLILARQGGIRSMGCHTESFCAPPKFRNKSDNIYSVHFDSMKFFIHDINKCTFGIYIYSLISLLHISASLIPSSGFTHMIYINCKNTVTQWITFVIYYILVNSNLGIEFSDNGVSDAETCKDDIRFLRVVWPRIFLMK